MKKGIAIQTILLLVVGIIVAGILVYLVYSYTTGQTLSAHECRAKMMSWCTNCYNVGGGTSITLPLELSNCLSDMGITESEGNDCDDVADTCEGFGVKY